MKPEHFKEFNVEHAQAGAPYCQRNGLAARIGIWDGLCTYKLSGFRGIPNGGERSECWNSDGVSESDVDAIQLVMLPLGMCEGKPVFVGDELINGGGRAFAVNAKTQLFSSHKWPHTAPVMPRFNLQISRSATNTPTDTGFSEIIAQHLLRYRRIKIEAYWKALDEFNGVTK